MTFRLEEHPEILTSIVETMVEAITILDPEGNIIYANTQAKSVFGLTPSGVTKRRYNSPEWEILDFHGDPIPDGQLSFQKVLRTGEMLFNDGLSIKRPNGERRYLNVNGAPIKNAEGKIIYLVFSVHDITDNYLMTQNWRKNRDQLELIFNAVPALVFLKDTKNNHIRVNKAVADALGVTPKDVANTPCAQFYPDEAEMYYKDDLEVIRSGKPKIGIVEQNVTKSGKIWVRTDKYPLFDKDGRVEQIIVFALDITDQIKTQEKIIDHLTQLELILNAVPALVFFKDTRNNIIRVNKAAAELQGVQPEDMEDTPTKQWYPEEADAYFADDLEVIRSKKPKTGIIEQHEVEGNRKIWVKTDKYPVLNDKGEVESLILFAQDITQQKINEERIKQSELLFRSFFENAGTGAVIVNNKREFIQVNNAYCNMLGYTRDELIGKKVEEITHPDDAGMTVSVIDEVVEKVEKNTIDIEKRYIRKDGEVIWVRVTANWVSDQDGNTLYGIAVISNINDRKRAESILREHQLELESRVKERTSELDRKNLALNEVLGQIEIEKKQMQDNILANIEDSLLPMLEKLRRKGTKYDHKYIDIIEDNLRNITSSFSRKLSVEQLKLTPKEVEICNMIKNGMSTKEISQALNLSSRTVENHRNHIRTKLGISRKGVNLTTYLQSL